MVRWCDGALKQTTDNRQRKTENINGAMVRWCDGALKQTTDIRQRTTENINGAMVRWCVVSAFLLAPVSVKMVKGLTNLKIELSHALSESAQRWAGCAWAGLLSVSSNAPSHHRTIVPFMFFIVNENFVQRVGWSLSSWAGQLTPKCMG